MRRLKMGRPVGEGISKCREALGRIEKGIFNISKHRGKRITPALVSKEAGLDAGFIKKGRELHKPLMDWISRLNGDNDTQDISTTKPKAVSSKKHKETIAMLKERLSVSVSKEILLLETIRELEARVKKLTDKSKKPADYH
jgi:hypothetical protein